MELARDTTPNDNVRAADWFAWLASDDQRECAHDFDHLALIDCHADHPNYAQLWLEWVATAEAWHEPRVRAALLDRDDSHSLELARP